MNPETDLVSTNMVPTPSQTAGPFFAIELTTDEHCVRCVAGPEAKGERVSITFRVLDGDGVPVNDAMLEIWQADPHGKYNHPDDQQPKELDPGWIGFGRLASGADGTCVLETVKPGGIGPNTEQAPHLAVAVFARGMLKQLYTRVYFAGDAANESDPILRLIPAERRGTLLAQPEPGRPGHFLFDVRLQGDQETVFFDV